MVIKYMDNLNCSQIKALWKYINDRYVIIESGRESGKTQTLMAIIKYWVKHQAKNNDVCVIVSRYLCSADILMKKIAKDLRVDNNIEKILVTPSIITICNVNGTHCYISICSGIRNYFYDVYNRRYAGVNISLLVGDECYIDPEWCDHTACAYTQYRDVVTLEYDSDVKSEIIKLKNVMNKKDFDREYGQYL